jgi:hypothetical protein
MANRRNMGKSFIVRSAATLPERSPL